MENDVCKNTPIASYCDKVIDMGLKGLPKNSIIKIMSLNEEYGIKVRDNSLGYIETNFLNNLHTVIFALPDRDYKRHLGEFHCAAEKYYYDAEIVTVLEDRIRIRRSL